MFSYLAVRYEPLVAVSISLGTVIVMVRAIEEREYSWAVALLTILVAFSPHFLETKIFLVAGIVCIVTATTLLATFQLRPLAEV
jgi:predicted branched-subunit amino acid permease